MDPTSPASASRNSPTEPTPEELEAQASLPRAPEPLESRAADPPRPPAVHKIIEKHDNAPHAGLALSLGVSAAAGPGIGIGAEASVGVVIDPTDRKLELFVSSGWGTALVSAVSVGASSQVSLVKNLEKCWGSSAEHGVNLPGGGLALSHSTPEPGGDLEPNAITESLGPSLGVDAHYYEGKTERISLSLEKLTQTLQRFTALPGLRRLGI